MAAEKACTQSKLCLRHLFLYFRFLNKVDSKQMVKIKYLPMTGFELQTSGVISDRSTNWSTTT